MTFIFDASFGHAEITPEAMHRVSCPGVILYAGCAELSKNATKAEVQALLAAGIQVGLVIENHASDAIGGNPVGTRQGGAIVVGAKQVGYDWQNCVLFGGYDTDAHAGDYGALLAYMEGFASIVPVPGYYGDSDSIDYLHQRHPDWIYWQSESTSFSPRNPTPNAHLWQQYNDARAQRLPVDVNNVLRTPLRLMGEDMPLTAADKADLVKATVNEVFHHALDAQGTTFAQYIRQIRASQDPAAVAAAIVAKMPAGSAVDQATVEAGLKAFFAAAANAAP